MCKIVCIFFFLWLCVFLVYTEINFVFTCAHLCMHISNCLFKFFFSLNLFILSINFITSSLKSKKYLLFEILMDELFFSCSLLIKNLIGFVDTIPYSSKIDLKAISNYLYIVSLFLIINRNSFSLSNKSSWIFFYWCFNWAKSLFNFKNNKINSN